MASLAPIALESSSIISSNSHEFSFMTACRSSSSKFSYSWTKSLCLYFSVLLFSHRLGFVDKVEYWTEFTILLITGSLGRLEFSPLSMLKILKISRGSINPEISLIISSSFSNFFEEFCFIQASLQSPELA